MALIKCPECGEQVSDKADVCIHCGYPLKNITENNQQEAFNEENENIHNEKINSENTEESKEENKRVDEGIPFESSKSHGKRRNTSFILVLVIGVLLVGGIFFYKNVYSPAHNYKQANKLMKKGEYSEALEIFNELNDYKKSKDNILECEYQIAIAEMQDESKLESSKNRFEKLEEYKESYKYLKECYYQLGIENYENGNFDEALEYLVPIQEEYDIETYREKAIIMTMFEGDWVGLSTNVEIKGWTITNYDKDNNAYKTYKINKESLLVNSDNPIQSVFKDDSENKYYFNENGQLVEEFNLGVSDYDPIILEYTKGEFSKTPKEEPQIGMTSEEVLNSTWGEPEDINKDTYSWGVKEQWCYPDNKYIYLEDDIVTSISE